MPGSALQDGPCRPFLPSSRVVVALAAFVQARRSARQVAQLTEMYWQLKYEHGELKATVTPAGRAAASPTATPSCRSAPSSAIRREPEVADGLDLA